METRNNRQNFRDGHDIFFAAIEKTRMPMILTDPNQEDNPIVFLNQAFLELTGYEEHEIMGRNCRFLQGEGTDRSKVQQVRDAIEARRDVSVEMINYRKDGSLFWNALYISPVYDDDGTLKYFFASQLDVTRRASAEEALRQAQKMEAVGQLTGGIAHDFNNMLTVILGNLELVKDKANGQEGILRPLDRAVKGALHAEKLTAQLLAFARKQQLNNVPTSLNEVIRSTIDILDRTLGDNVQINMDLDNKAALVDVDIVQLNVAILNVVINARDAMKDGGEIKISTFNRHVKEVCKWELNPGYYSVISFRDSGHGIPAEHLKRVTEPFYTTKAPGKGTGMGLAMVYGFMKQSGGHLTISSDENGTEIRFYFPHSDKAKAHNETIQRQFDGSKSKEKLLIVEDNEQVLEMVREIVEDQGYDVRFAINADDAQKLVQDGFHPDILCTDIMMPGSINGIELARKMRADMPGIKVLLCTGWTDQNLEDTKQFPVLFKPYRPSQLVTRLNELVHATHQG